MNVKIIVCTHKVVDMPQHEYFFPIEAGASLHHEAMPYVPDNTGENISSKNQHYCELTAHYWAWKNLKGQADIIGLNHYRRFFDFNRKWQRFSPDRSFTSVTDFLNKQYIFPDLEKLLHDYDIILPNSRNYPFCVSTQYAAWHIVDDWRILKEVIRELSPEYIPAFETSMEHRNSYSGYNMFITKWDLFAEYSEWLFKILFEVEKRCKLSDYPVQSRIFGYMSERLINVFCEYKKLRIKHIPVIMPIDDFQPYMNPTNLRYCWWTMRNDLAFKIAPISI